MAPLVVLVILIRGPLKGCFVWAGCVARLVGGFGGICQTQVRGLLAYSSINHMGWLVVGGVFRVVGAVVYFVLYAVIMGLLFYFLAVFEVGNYLILLKGVRGVRVKQLLILSILLITLAGLPPTIGFSMKWAVISAVVLCSPISASLLLIGSTLRLYYYSCLRFCWYSFAFSKV